MRCWWVLLTVLFHIYIPRDLNFKVKFNKPEEVTSFYVQQMAFVTYFQRELEVYARGYWAVLLRPHCCLPVQRTDLEGR